MNGKVFLYTVSASITAFLFMFSLHIPGHGYGIAAVRALFFADVVYCSLMAIGSKE